MQIKEGKYAARVVAAVLTETSGDEKQPVVEVTVELTGNGLDAPVELSKSFYFSERPDSYNDNKPEWQVSLERLRKLGFVGDDIDRLDSVIGFVGAAGVKNKTSARGTTYSAVSWIDRENAQPMERAKATSFAAQMKAKMQAAGVASGAASSRPQSVPARAPAPKAAPAPQRKPTPPADDFAAPDESDVPF